MSRSISFLFCFILSNINLSGKRENKAILDEVFNWGSFSCEFQVSENCMESTDLLIEFFCLGHIPKKSLNDPDVIHDFPHKDTACLQRPEHYLDS